MKFGVDIPCGVPQVYLKHFFEIPIFSNLMAFFKALGLVIFRGLKSLEFSRLFQPFQWIQLNENWCTSSLRYSLLIFLSVFRNSNFFKNYGRISSSGTYNILRPLDASVVPTFSTFQMELAQRKLVYIFLAAFPRDTFKHFWKFQFFQTLWPFLKL